MIFKNGQKVTNLYYQGKLLSKLYQDGKIIYQRKQSLISAPLFVTNRENFSEILNKDENSSAIGLQQFMGGQPIYIDMAKVGNKKIKVLVLGVFNIWEVGNSARYSKFPAVGGRQFANLKGDRIEKPFVVTVTAGSAVTPLGMGANFSQQTVSPNDKLKTISIRITNGGRVFLQSEQSIAGTDFALQYSNQSGQHNQLLNRFYLVIGDIYVN